MTNQHGREPTRHGRREVRYTKTFRKDLEIAKSHRKCNVAELQRVMETIERNEPLDKKYKDHALRGRYPDQKGGHTDCRECHVCTTGC